MTFSTPVYPPGYRFVPTDVELVTYYLARQTAGLSSPSNPVLEVQIYDYSPDDIFKNHNLSEDDIRYFFSSRMKRYNNGSRPDRSAGAGFWKATGAKTKVYDKNGRVVGSRTSLVYHKKQPSSKSPKKTNWLMMEYQIKQNGPQLSPLASNKGMLNHNLSEDDIRYFFSSRMKRYNNGSRPDRSAGAGFWKATGAKTKVYDKNGRVVGSRTSLVYHKKQPSSKSPKKTNWLMMEYQIKQNGPQLSPLASNKGMLLDKWVLCKIYRGKRSSSEKSRKDRNVPVLKKDQQELAYEEPASLPPAPVSQLDEMMQSSQEACSLLNGEQPDPQPSHGEQVNPILDLDHMKVDEVKRYFQESQSASNKTLMSLTDPQSSYDGHINPIQDISDMRVLKPNDMDFKPLTSDNTKTNNLHQNVVKAPEAQHNQQFLQEPHDTPFCYFDSALYYNEATTMEFFTEPLMTNELVYDFPIFDPESDFFAAHITSFQSNEAFTSSSSFT